MWVLTGPCPTPPPTPPHPGGCHCHRCGNVDCEQTGDIHVRNPNMGGATSHVCHTFFTLLTCLEQGGGSRRVPLPRLRPVPLRTSSTDYMDGGINFCRLATYLPCCARGCSPTCLQLMTNDVVCDVLLWAPPMNRVFCVACARHR